MRCAIPFNLERAVLAVAVVMGCDAVVVRAPHGSGDGVGAAGTGGIAAGGASSATATTSGTAGFPPEDHDGHSACVAACEADPCVGFEELCIELCFEDIFDGCGPASFEAHWCATTYCDSDDEPDCEEELSALQACKGSLECGPISCIATADGCDCFNECEAGHTHYSQCSINEAGAWAYECHCFMDDELWTYCEMNDLTCTEHDCCGW